MYVFFLTIDYILSRNLISLNKLKSRVVDKRILLNAQLRDYENRRNGYFSIFLSSTEDTDLRQLVSDYSAR